MVKAPWLTPGPEVAGLRLTAVNASTVTARGRTLHGVELIYGPLGHGPYALTIDELRRPEDPQFWQYIPRGSIAVQGGESGSGRTAHADWTGYVVRYGVYVTIETSRGERAVLSVARTLQPAS